MKTKAAVLWGLNEKWQVEEIDLDPPNEGEVQVKLAASGLCHSDEHLVTGDIPIPFPVVGGHEGAGIVEAVGANVTEVAEGDPVVLSFLPACGKCSYCARGMTNLCDLGGAVILGRSWTAPTGSILAARTRARCACWVPFPSARWCPPPRW